MSIPTLSHKVKKGETLASIAKKRGFAGKDQKKIFAAKYNGKLRKLRSGLDTIEIGDIVNFPAVTAAKLDDLIKKLNAWINALELSLDSAHQLKEAELKALKKDRDYYLTRVKVIIKRSEAGINLEPEKRRAERDCRIWFELEKSLSIPQIATCGALLNQVAALQNEYRKKLKGSLIIELKTIMDVQKEIWSLETLIVRSIKAERDAQSLLRGAIGIAKKLKASMF